MYYFNINFKSIKKGFLYKIAVFLKILTVFVTEFYKSHLTSGSVENAFFAVFCCQDISSTYIIFMKCLHIKRK